MLITTSQTWDKAYKEAAWVGHPGVACNKYNLLEGSRVVVACRRAHVAPKRNDTEGPNTNHLIYAELH